MCNRLNRVLLVSAAIILAAWLGTRLYAKYVSAERLDKAKTAAVKIAGEAPADKGNTP
jgi:hypothetical protein